MEEAISNVGYLTTDDDINRMAAIQLENSQVCKIQKVEIFVKTYF